MVYSLHFEMQSRALFSDVQISVEFPDNNSF